MGHFPEITISRLYFGLFSMLFFLVGCAAAPTPKPVASGPVYHLELASAVKDIAERLSDQVPANDLQNVKGVPVDLFFNEHSAESAAIAKGLQQQLISAMSSVMPTGEFSPLNTRNIQAAQWVVLAGYANMKAEEAGKAGNWVRLKVVFADVKTGAPVAQVVTYLDAKQFNSDPSRFSKEAPMYLIDAAHKDRTAVLAGETRPISDSLRLRAQIGEAIEVYESGQYADAEIQFRKIVEAVPDNVGALSGLYQVLWRQGKKAEAEKAFGRLASASIDTGILSVRLLFKLSSTEFIDESDLGQQYQLWLKAIALQVAEKKICLDVTGHASASGSVEYNNNLSLSRATRIVARMKQLSSAKGDRLKAYGKGFSEAVVGTGANDASDAIDRRVAFSVRTCG